MNILLIYPYFVDDRIHVEEIRAMPLGIYSIAALLKKKGYSVDILNCYDARKTPPQSIAAVLKRLKPDVIGFSVLHANRWGAIDIARIAKKILPDVKVVFGGVGATFLWKHLLTHFPEIDAIVLGEGEYTFLKLIESFNKREESGALREVRGIAFRDGKTPDRTEEATPIEDLDGLPIPAEYFDYQHVSSSRGCAWNCAFCGSPQFWGRRVRYRSPEHFVKELEMLYARGIRFYYFSDDTFTAKRNRVIDICRRILEKGLEISWYAISRVHLVDDEVLYWMRRAGCIQISFGLESGSEKIRHALGKDIQREQIKKAFELTVRYGILSRAYFIYGCPGESRKTIRETLELMDEIKPLGVIFYILDLFPGTRLYEDYTAKCGINDDIWLNRIEGLMYFQTDPLLTESSILDFGKQLRNTFEERVAGYADAIALIDKKELYEKHADFLSRLAMTFSHGDYAKRKRIGKRGQVAEKLFRKSLEYCPNHRAYLGLGMMKQRQGENETSTKILREGLSFFPESENLHVCLGVNHMNAGNFAAALKHFSQFPKSRQVQEYVEECRKAIKE